MQNFYHNKYSDARVILYEKGNSFGVGLLFWEKRGQKEGKGG